MPSTVSIVMCTYNGAKYVREQIESILNQTYPLAEIIIQDDGSTDETMEILAEYAETDKRIRVYRHTGEHGVNANFLSAMQRATGDYIAISDQDDIWECDKIAVQMKNIGDKLLCSGHTRPFSTDGSFAFFDQRVRNTSIFRMLFNCLPGHSLLFRRELLSMLPPLEHPFYRVSLYDAAISITASAHQSVVYVDKVLVNFRRHAEATTYNDYSTSLPSWRNALHQLVWSITHYHAAKRVVLPIFKGKLALLESIPNAKNNDFIDAERIMQLECGSGFSSIIRLQWLFIKHSDKLFHTTGGGITKKIRAALYPFMQLYMYHESV